jgi:hypothetical protein
VSVLMVLMVVVVVVRCGFGDECVRNGLTHDREFTRTKVENTFIPRVTLSCFVHINTLKRDCATTATDSYNTGTIS